MDNKRRINPQNPPRQIRGRKQKKQRVLDVLAVIPSAAPSVAETRPEAAPEGTTVYEADQHNNT